LAGLFVFGGVPAVAGAGTTLVVSRAVVLVAATTANLWANRFVRMEVLPVRGSPNLA
jgi:hypothetical protein